MAAVSLTQRPGRSGALGPWLIFAAIVLVAVLFGGWLRAVYNPEWKPGSHFPGRPWMAEADCYSQLARVQRIQSGQGLIQRHFAKENWPEGLTPSTTATFDYAILAVEAPVSLFTSYPLDWAGTLISPLLALVLIVFWSAFRGESFTILGRGLLVLGFALLPILVWSTAFGRPRHQSLILVLMGMALVAEFERWQVTGKGWHIRAGILWGLLCWTSLYEPLFALLVLLVFNLAVRRRESWDFLISFGALMLVALLLEGVHVFVPSPDMRPYLSRWLGQIAEMQSLTLVGMLYRMTYALVFLPWVAWSLWRSGEAADRLVAILTFLLIVLTFLQERWLPYACLGEIFLLARFLQAMPRSIPRWGLAAIFVIGLFVADYSIVGVKRGMIRNQPSAELAHLSRAIDQPGGILAPWWISPGLLYFSGQPIVSGSSHCGISGIVASARFYTATSWVDADQVLAERRVRWVVIWDDPNYVYPVLASSQQILGLPVSNDQDKGNADVTVAEILARDRDLPANLHLRAVTPHLKLYEVASPGEASQISTAAPVVVR